MDEARKRDEKAEEKARSVESKVALINSMEQTTKQLNEEIRTGEFF